MDGFGLLDIGKKMRFMMEDKVVEVLIGAIWQWGILIFVPSCSEISVSIM